jgi:hypothetical protein
MGMRLGCSTSHHRVKRLIPEKIPSEIKCDNKMPRYKSTTEVMKIIGNKDQIRKL